MSAITKRKPKINLCLIYMKSIWAMFLINNLIFTKKILMKKHTMHMTWMRVMVTCTYPPKEYPQKCTSNCRKKLSPMKDMNQDICGQIITLIRYRVHVQYYLKQWSHFHICLEPKLRVSFYFRKDQITAMIGKDHLALIVKPYLWNRLK